MKWFKMDEFKCHCCGKIGAPEAIEALVDNVLDPAREKLGAKVIVSSGYRCPHHNDFECPGASKTSQHKRSEAADVKPSADSGRTVKELARIIVENGRYDQVIVYPTFVHVSWKRVGVNRKMILRKTATGYQRIDAASI